MANRPVKTITEADVKKAAFELKSVVSDITLYRKTFFANFLLGDKVPERLVPYIFRFVKHFYNVEGLGYNGVMSEIKDRVELYAMIEGSVEVKEFLLHKQGQTDFYDSDNRIAYEKKTGCGSWLYSEKNYLLEDIIEEYKRKTRLLRWDYDFTPPTETMKCGKTVAYNEKIKGAKPQKQYPIHIHCEITYKKFFEYLATYPTGINTFFKENARSGKAGTYIYDLQTIKNSKKKIAFLEGLNNL